MNEEEITFDESGEEKFPSTTSVGLTPMAERVAEDENRPSL